MEDWELLESTLLQSIMLANDEDFDTARQLLTGVFDIYADHYDIGMETLPSIINHELDFLATAVDDQSK